MFKPEYNLLKQAGRPACYKHTEKIKTKMPARHLERVWGDNKVTDTSTGKIIQVSLFGLQLRLCHVHRTQLLNTINQVIYTNHDT